jgi:hypothetical protein
MDHPASLSAIVVSAFLSSATIVACGGEPPSSGEGSREPAPAAVSVASQSLTATLAANGYTVGRGRFSFLDMTQCCATSCEGNNPTSPYAAFYVPTAPGEDPNPNADADGLANVFHLRADEAIVFIGPTPPESRYFGFTPYLTDRAADDGSRRSVAASLSETLNDLVIRAAAQPVFQRTVAIVAAADATTRRNVVGALVSAGFPQTAINALVFDPALSRFGLDEAADRFSVLFRVALPTDAAALQAYIAEPGANVYRVTPNAIAAPSPLPSPAARTKDMASELDLSNAVDRLGEAVVAAYPDYVASELAVDDGVADPLGCIDGQKTCAFDNRDATYPAIKPRVLFSSDDDFYVAYGVDHQVSAKASYASVSVYALNHLVGITAVASPQYPGSAQNYLESTDTDAAKLFAWKIARHCNGEPYCLEVPKGGCPTGMFNGQWGSLAFRTYLEPTSKTAPSPDTLMRDRVIYFHR